MSSPSQLWSAGHYESVAEQIAEIATAVVDAVATPLDGAAVVDLACGTGSAALLAAGRGSVVTAVDITPELLTLAERKAQAAGAKVTWVAADAADTELPARSFDVAVSNMGIIFVEPNRLVAELARLLRAGGQLSFSAWSRTPDNPFSTPIATVLGPPAPREFAPDQWSDPDTAATRLAPHFDDIRLEAGTYTWRFGSLAAAMRFVTRESPVHVATFRQAGDRHRDALQAAFEDAMRAHLQDGAIAFASPYVVVTATRR